MITANELRVGNWLIGANGEFQQVAYVGETIGLRNKAGGTDKYQKNPIISFDINDLRRIPLTSEILTRLGFKCDGTQSVKRYSKLDFEGNGLVFDFDDGIQEPWFQIWSNWKYVDHKKRLYLHEAQNLYFDLTSEELQIDL